MCEPIVQGEKVREFEKAVAEYVGTKYAVAVSSGTAALHIALLSFRIKQGDLVAVPAYSFPATANVVKLCGAEPVFIDIDPDTFNMSVDHLHSVLREYKDSIKAIVPVHCFGLMADMDNIIALADRYVLPLIEDAACALGSSLSGKKAGSWGDAGCFSFHPLKLITTGEGGMITTNNPGVFEAATVYRDHGRKSGKFIFPGFNYRMTDFQAALGLSQFQALNDIIIDRQQKAITYNGFLMKAKLGFPAIRYPSLYNCQSYVVKVPDRDRIRIAMLDAGIETSIGTYYIPGVHAHKDSAFCRVAEEVSKQTLGLPMYDRLTFEDQEYIANTLLEALNAEK